MEGYNLGLVLFLLRHCVLVVLSSEGPTLEVADLEKSEMYKVYDGIITGGKKGTT